MTQQWLYMCFVQGEGFVVDVKVCVTTGMYYYRKGFTSYIVWQWLWLMNPDGLWPHITSPPVCSGVDHNLPGTQAPCGQLFFTRGAVGGLSKVKAMAEGGCHDWRRQCGCSHPNN